MSVLRLIAAAGVLALALPVGAKSPPSSSVSSPAPSRADVAARRGEAAFRALYRELVEINTAASTGSCTAAAEAMKVHLVAAGYPESDLQVIVPPGHPKEGNLIGLLPGADTKLKPLMLLAHIDVVEAKREDWVRDPFKLTEEGGYFYARGAEDDKSEAAIYADMMVRFRNEGYRPNRGVRLALTCGEEGAWPLDGVDWLIANKREAIDAAFALNEGGGGSIDHTTGKYVFHGIEAAEKLYQDYTLEVTNAGGHSSRPVPDNAIYRLAGALKKIEAYSFPVEASPVTTAFFAREAELELEPRKAADMRAYAKAPGPGEAAEHLLKDPSANSNLHTTCVATELAGGHAPNALPQRASANVNCRIFPGLTAAATKTALERAVGDVQVKIAYAKDPTPASPPPPLTPEIMAPIERLSAEMWPGVPVIPFLLAGATDGSSLNSAGIPTYGVSGVFEDDELSHEHGLNESVPVKSLMDGRAFLYRLVKAYAGGK